MEKNFNEQESLKLIANMIAQAKDRFQKRNGNSIILWGYSIMILALVNFALLQILDAASGAYAYSVWLCTIPIFIANYLNEARKSRQAHASNYIDKLAGYVWLAFFISVLILTAAISILAGAILSPHAGLLFHLITPLIMGITGLCLFVNGKIYRFQAFVYGSAVFWTGALFSVFIPVVWKMQGLQFVALAICMVFGFILPGYMLNRKANQDV
jgi:hypothetical protein